jgi:uncharacterized protein (TIGR00661 family)
MAKILYGVAGEGFGHSSRSDLIGRRLLDCGHDVLFAASGKSLSYLSEPFTDRVNEVYGLHFIYRKGKVHPLYTVLDNLAKYRRGLRINRELFAQKIEDFEPDLVISDFEPFSAWWAWRNNVPSIGIDHEHCLTTLALQNVPGWIDRVKAQVVTLGYHAFARAYVVMNFFQAPLRHPKAVLVPPAVRKCVMELPVSRGSHITVYSTDSRQETKEKYLSLFGRLSPQPFYIYGFNIEEQHDNCFFRKTSTRGFLNDLASCAGVIASAGFSLISECLYLKKRMLLAPVKGQFEQQVNAVYAQRLGFARYPERIDDQHLRLFLNDTEKEFSRDNRILWPDNEAVFRILNQVLSQILDRSGVSLDLTGITGRALDSGVISHCGQKASSLPQVLMG